MRDDSDRRPADLPLALALVGLAAAAALLFGGNRPWVWAPLAALAGLLLAGWGGLRWAGLAGGGSLRPIVPAMACYGAALLWLAVQASGITPAHLDHPAWAAAAGLLGRPFGGAISAEPGATWAMLLRLSCHGAVFLLAFQLGQSRPVAIALLLAATAVAGLVALYGLAEQFAGWRSVLWEAKRYYTDSVTGTFVGRNAFAGYAAVGAIAAFVLMTNPWVNDRLDGLGPRATAMAAANRLSTLRGAMPAVAGLALGVGLLLSHSRAGALSGLAGLVAAAALVSVAASRRRRRLSLALPLTLAVLALIALAGGGVLDRMLGLADPGEARWRLYDMALQAIAERPLLGSGGGTFAAVAAAQRNAETDIGLYAIESAHSTYLENAAEMGIPAALLLFLAVGWVAWLCARGVFRRHGDLMLPALGAGISVSVGLHAAVDFSLQVPGVAITYALLLGVAAAQSRPRSLPGGP